MIVFGSILPESSRHVGCIDPACDVETVINDAYENAQFLCERLAIIYLFFKYAYLIHFHVDYVFLKNDKALIE